MTYLPPKMRHTCAVSRDRAGSAQAAASAYFTDSSYVRTNLQLVNKEMGIDAPRVACPLQQELGSRARMRPPTLFNLSKCSVQQPSIGKIVADFHDAKRAR